MKTANSNFVLCVAAAILLWGSCPARAQSINQNSPTPVTGPEIRGRIKARDIGDSRLTTYFYAFDGEQGDVFVNVVTKNFNGDIDIFTVDGLRPLTKIVMYASGGLDETGRIVYLRKPEKLLLRIEGRTPDDDPATFAIKFAGSFVALKPVRGSGEPGPEAKEPDDKGGVRLNSAGAMITKPSQTDVKKRPTDTEATKADSKASVDKKDVKKPDEKSTSGKKPADVRTGENTGSGKTTETTKPPAGTKTPPTVSKETGSKTDKDPMAGVKFVVSLKDGTSFQRPMTEIQRFSADKGFLLIITKDGAIVRYLLVDIASITMQ